MPNKDLIRNYGIHFRPKLIVSHLLIYGVHYGKNLIVFLHGLIMITFFCLITLKYGDRKYNKKYEPYLLKTGGGRLCLKKTYSEPFFTFPLNFWGHVTTKRKI